MCHCLINQIQRSPSFKVERKEWVVEDCHLSERLRLPVCFPLNRSRRRQMFTLPWCSEWSGRPSHNSSPTASASFPEAGAGGIAELEAAQGAWLHRPGCCGWEIPRYSNAAAIAPSYSLPVGAQIELSTTHEREFLTRHDLVLQMTTVCAKIEMLVAFGGMNQSVCNENNAIMNVVEMLLYVFRCYYNSFVNLAWTGSPNLVECL